MYTLEQRYQRLQRQLVAGLAILIGIILLGTIGYCTIEGWSVLDATYMTVITLTTVGFSEINSLSNGGRMFTIGLIFSGIVTIGFILNRFTAAVIEGYFQKGIHLQRQKHLIERLKQHYILCGFGRTAQQIATEFSAEHIKFVVIDTDPQAIETAQELGYIALQADATLDDSLTQAGVEQAIGLVATLPTDAENLYVVLSAKTLNANLRAIARANGSEAIQKLQRAGADVVVAPYLTSGKRMAAAALRPRLLDIVDGIVTGHDRSFFMEEFVLESQNCPCLQQTLQTIQTCANSGAMVLEIRHKDGTWITGPTGEVTLQDGDILICMGTAEQLRRLDRVLLPPTPGLAQDQNKGYQREPE